MPPGRRLGSLCIRGHEYKGTGKSLRYERPSYRCVVCAASRVRAKPGLSRWREALAAFVRGASTTSDIRRDLSYSSVQAAQRLVRSLENKGLIERVGRSTDTRSMEVGAFSYNIRSKSIIYKVTDLGHTTHKKPTRITQPVECNLMKVIDATRAGNPDAILAYHLMQEQYAVEDDFLLLSVIAALEVIECAESHIDRPEKIKRTAVRICRVLSDLQKHREAQHEDQPKNHVAQPSSTEHASEACT